MRPRSLQLFRSRERNYFGGSPISPRIFRKFRFDQTAQQLVDWGVKVDLSKAREVAYEVGLRSLTHFNRIFRRLVGQSPTVYRRGAKKPG